MSELGEKARRFLDLHRPGEPLLLPNPWDAGSARLLESLGFRALATTSSGHAATLGRLDGRVTREEAIASSAGARSTTGRWLWSGSPPQRRRLTRGRVRSC